MDIKQQKTLNAWKLETDEVNPNINFCSGRVLEMALKEWIWAEPRDHNIEKIRLRIQQTKEGGLEGYQYQLLESYTKKSDIPQNVDQYSAYNEATWKHVIINWVCVFLESSL